MVGTPESQSRGLKWSSPDRQMAQLLRARTVPISLHPCYSPPLGSAHLWTGLEGNECGPPGLTGGPCYSVHFVLSQRSVRAHLAKQKPPTLIQGSTVLKVSVGFLFFSSSSLSNTLGFSVGSCHGYSKVRDHLWARF